MKKYTKYIKYLLLPLFLLLVVQFGSGTDVLFSTGEGRPYGSKAESLTPLSESIFAISFGSYYSSTGMYPFYTIYNANGTQLFNATQIGGGVNNAQYPSHVTSVDTINSSAFMMCWGSAICQKINKDGSLIGSAITVDSNDFPRNIEVRVFNEDNFVVGYSADSKQKFTTYINGVKKITISVASQSYTSISLDILDNDSFVYTISNGYGRFGIYNINGTPELSMRDVGTEDLGGRGYVTSVTALNSSHFVIAEHDDSLDDIIFYICQTNGSCSSKYTVDSNSGGDSDEIKTSLLNSSAFIISWADNPENLVNYKIYEFDGTFIRGGSLLHSAPDALYGIGLSGKKYFSQMDFCDSKFVLAYHADDTHTYWQSLLANGSSWDGSCNSAPTTTSLTISPTTIYTNTDTNISANYTDSDGDNGTVYFQCYVNNVNVYNKTFTDVVTGTSPSFIFDSGNYSKNDKINCSVYANDGTVDGDIVWSSVYTVSNSLPAITTPFITPTTVYTNTDLTISSVYSDTDADSGTLYFKCYKDNVNFLNKTFSSITIGTNKSWVMGSDNFSKGNKINCSVYANDGSGASSTKWSNIITVLNSAPSTPTDISGFPSNLYVGNTLSVTATGSSDLDSDSITYYYKFYNVNDATTVQDWSTTNSYTIQTTDSHNTIRVYAKATTIDANSTEYSEDDVVENSNPEITLNIPYDNDHNNVQQQSYSFTFSDIDGDANNCTLWINDILEGTNLTVTSSTSITSSSTLNDGTYSWHIKCDDGYGGINTTSDFTYIIDTVFPNIDPNNPKYDNSTVINQNFQDMILNITGTDTYLFASKVDIINSTGDSQWQRNVTGLSTTTYSFNDTIDMSAWREGTYRANISYSDDHTAKKIKPYFVEKKANGLKYITPKGTEINIDSADENDVSSVNTTKLVDRYTFNFKYKNSKSQVSYYLNSNEKIFYRGNLYPFPSFVSGSNWIDFNMNGTESYSVSKVNDFRYLITLRMKPIFKKVKEGGKDVLKKITGKQDFKFHSIGGLNVQNEVYSFTVQTNDAPVINEINLTPNTAYTNSTLQCNIAETDDENDTINNAFVWYDNGVVMAGQNSSFLHLTTSNFKGHTITCQATPSDEWQSGTAVNTSIVISNWVPVITPATINNVFLLDNSETWSYDFNATEIDSADTLLWSDNSPYISINSSTGKVSFLSNETNIGDHSITIQVTDGTAPDSLAFHLVVLNTTLQSVTYSAPSRYNINDSITAYQNLTITNPSTTLTATGLDYTFSTPGSWETASSSSFTNINLSPSSSRNLRLNLTQRPGTEVGYTPVYSNGVGMSGYEEFVYDVTISINSDDVGDSVIRYDIPLDRFPSSYSLRTVNLDKGEVDGNSTNVNIENSHYIDVLTNHSGTFSLHLGEYKFSYKYFVYSGPPSYSGGGGGGDSIPYTLVTPITNNSCNIHILTKTTVITPTKQSLEIHLKNTGNVSMVPSIEWLDPENGSPSAKDKMEIANSIVAIQPNKEESIVIRYVGPFGNETEKVRLRVYGDSSKVCSDEVIITIKPKDKFNVINWLNEKIRTVHIPNTEKTFTFTNLFFVVMFAIIAIFVAVVVPVNIPSKVILFILINILLTGFFAVGLNLING